MALGDLFVKGSYTNIHSIHYCKHECVVRFNMITYQTPARLCIINERAFALNSKKSIIDVKSVTLKSPPQTPALNDAYYVSPGCSDEWAYLPESVVIWNGQCWMACGQHPLYDLQTGRYMEFRGDSLVENSEIFDMRKFNTFFSSDKISGGSDILKQIYKYLKTLPLYTSAKDI